ncbi:LacI family DNA-binding transcriptional regulator [Motilimonas eburnea]|uniref:LacI family DNA-binding transcriptional regulator n=1 Tax=Motilimonas eburnea TaxID=1737488 RepID=UPI001E4C5222|nr:LacI family DNA-binding transcriptional regulator [Motilimonas eburnea]MCE2572179.1 LacI family transcriptional regulator [Motilimonas eburnea]
MASISDVAKKAGVSKSTVSRVLNPGGSVSSKTRAIVEQAIAELNFHPNGFAQGLKSNKSGMIGVVMVDISSPYYAMLLGGIQSRLNRDQHSILTTSSFGKQEKEANAIQTFKSRQCDGLIVYLENQPDPATIKRLNYSQTPVVTLGLSAPTLSPNSVLVDNEYGGYLAAQHLIQYGHKNILMLAGLPRYPDAIKRKAGFIKAMQDAGIDETHYQIIHGEFSEEFGYQETQKLLRSNCDYTAICAGDDDIAAGVLLALRQARVKVPQDISVIGYDDNFHAKHTYPALTTVRQPIDSLGVTATDLLFEIMADPHHLGKDIILKPELVERDSVGPAVDCI